MKPTKLMTGLIAAALATPAFGLTFEISGATAFRRGTIESIHALYVASGQPFRFGSNRADADYVNADLVIWEGTIAGLPGTTIIRTSFNGSIEGLRAIAESPASDPPYYKTSVLTVTPAIGGAQEDGNGAGSGIGAIPTSGNTETAETEIAFSDTDKAISPYAADPMVGGPVGVAVFALVANEGAPITNVTVQQYNSLLSNGYVPLSFFTGNPADTSLVFCTGRNDGSGTRSSYLSEMGYGVANAVKQFLVVGSEGNFITALQEVPAGGVNALTPGAGGTVGGAGGIDQFDAQPGTAGFQDVTQLATSASIVWGQDIPGNGGAFSGSVLRGHLALRGDRVGGVSVFDANGTDLFGTAQNNVAMLSWISVNDAITARTNGASIIAFNGVTIDVNGPSNTLSTTDKAKVYNGMYSPWNFQQMYHRFGASTETVTLYNLIFSAVPNNLGSAGLKATDMNVGRADDGGTINPLL
ncbi:MAG: hypothetical protein MUF04_02510 [Akkermansiaceae bacterium]|jgi:hypothetical protein|nr:hypothetical protein [Akkermansiaceae bacterium]